MGLNPLGEADLSDRSEALRRGARSLNTLALFIVVVTLSGLSTLWLVRLVRSSPLDTHPQAMSGGVTEPLTLWHNEEGEDEEEDSDSDATHPNPEHKYTSHKLRAMRKLYTNMDAYSATKKDREALVLDVGVNLHRAAHGLVSWCEFQSLSGYTPQ